MLKQLERTGEDQISLTDPDSRAMAAHTKVAVGYNVQIAVDAKHKLIVDAGSDQPGRRHGAVAGDRRAGPRDPRSRTRSTSSRTRATSGPRTSRLARRLGLTPHVPRPQRGSSTEQGLLPQGRVSLRSRAGRLCLSGGSRTEAISLWQAARNDEDRLRQQSRRVADCPLRPRCTDAGYRAVSRLEHEDALDRMAARLEARPDILDRRRETVEHPFGTHQAMDESGRVSDATVWTRFAPSSA